MNIQKIKSLKVDIENSINGMNFENAEMLLKDFEKINYENLDILIYKSIIKFYKHEYEEAEELLMSALEVNPYNFDLNYNMAIVLETNNKYLEALKQYIKLYRLANDNLKEEIKNKLNDLSIIINENYSELTLNDISKIIKEEEEKNLFLNMHFPQCSDTESYIGKFLKDDYFVSKYDKYAEFKDAIDIPMSIETLGFHKIEMFKAELTNKKKFNDNSEKIIPIASLNNFSLIKINQENSSNVVENRLGNRFYYYKVDGAAEIEGDNLVIGEPIVLKHDNSKKKLVLNIFIDGLSQTFLEDYTLEKAMPHTYKYFSKGTICNNAYTVAEWTLPSVASIYSGKYITNHMIYHPRYNNELPKNNKILTELFKDSQYFVSKIDGNWRTVPLYGYYRGVDRTVYKKSLREMGVEEIVTELIEHMESFKETNQFIWTCVFDLHDIADEFDLKMLSTMNTDLKNLNYREGATKEKSVKQSHNENKKDRYLQQLRRIDLYLSILYNYINENYKDEDILVSLISDHGQSYFIPEGNSLLSPERIKIPMMFKGGQVKKGICEELIESIDFGRIISKLSGVSHEGFGEDSNLPVYFGGEKEREYSYSESIYPESPYIASINFEDYICEFKTEALVKDDGRVNIDKFNLILIDKHNRERFYDEEKYNKCLEIVLKHIEKLSIY